MVAPAGVLNHDRLACGQIAGASAAEPTTARGDIAILGNAPLTLRAGEEIPVGRVVGKVGIRFDDMPAFGFEHSGRALAADPLAHGEDKSFLRHSRQLEETLKLDVLLSIFFALIILRCITGPVHDGRPGPVGDIAGLFQRGEIPPILERDRLHSGAPFQARGRNLAASLADIQAKRIVPLVGENSLGVFRGGISRETDLREHRVAIEKKFQRNAGRFIAQPTGAGDICENIRRGEDFFGFGGTCHAVVFLVGDIPINPAVAHSKLLHDARQVGGVVRAISARLHLDRIVGPCARILEIPDIVPEGAESQRILDVIPRDPTERILPDQPSNNNPHFLQKLTPRFTDDKIRDFDYRMAGLRSEHACFYIGMHEPTFHCPAWGADDFFWRMQEGTSPGAASSSRGHTSSCSNSSACDQCRRLSAVEGTRARQCQ